MRRIILILTVLFSIPLVSATTITFPPTEATGNYTPSSALSCFTGNLTDITCVIGTGFSSLFGSLLFSIFVLIIMIVLCFKLRLPLDLSAIMILTFLIIIQVAINTSMMYYGLLLIVLIVVGYGIYKFWRR